MRAVLLIVIMLISIGCAARDSRLMTRLSVGMTKEQTLATMGQPDSAAAQSGVEYLRYDFYPPPPYWQAAQNEPYFVKLVDGKVESFGRLGDFDSTKDPGIRIRLLNE